MRQANSGAAQAGQYLQLPGLKMYYETYGSGKPLILLHGGTSTLAEWQAHIPSFARHFKVFALDSRGHGRTNNTSGELSYRQMAGDVAAFIQAAGLHQPFICGYSDGGQVALEIAMGYPHLAAAFVVGAAWYKFSPRYLNALQDFGLLGPGVVDIEHIREAEPETVAELQAKHTWAADPDYWQTLLLQISSMWWTPLDYTAEDFQKIQTPTLVLMGDRDGIIELEQAFEMYHLIPQAELAILPNATHLTTLDRQAAREIILDFLLRHSLTRRL